MDDTSDSAGSRKHTGAGDGISLAAFDKLVSLFEGARDTTVTIPNGIVNPFGTCASDLGSEDTRDVPDDEHDAGGNPDEDDCGSGGVDNPDA